LVPRGSEFAGGDDAMAEVILTPFYNYAMPLIRYVPGDFARIDQSPPPDARSLRRVRQLVGRVRNFFVLPSGRRWWPTYQNKLLRDFLDYRQVQFAQTAPDRIEIRYASDSPEPIKSEERLHAYLRSATPEPMMIAIKRVAEVPRRASGKYEDATCELDPAATAARIDGASGMPAVPSVHSSASRPFFAPLPSAPYRRTETIDRFLNAWRRTQHLPPQQLWNIQRDRLELLLRHARAHVPFYRDTGRLDPVFRRDGTIDWARWPEIPLLTRRDVQNAGEALHSERLLAEHGRTFQASTSGSTGEPVTVVHCALSAEAAWTAILLRDFERHDIDTARRYAHIGTFPRAGSSPGLRQLDAWYEQLAMIGRFGERLDIPETLTPKEIIDALESFRPAYVRVNPVALELLCAWDQERRLSDCGIDAIMPNADHLSDQAKRAAVDHIGCRILDRYASNECGFIAATCPHCERFHVHSEVVHLEVLDERREPVAPGKTGWVVVTPLYHYAMPLIRYDHADQARVGLPHKCQITLPALDVVDGKAPTIFVFPGGRQVRPVVPFGSITKLLGAQAFQVAQVAEDRCEFRIVPGRLLPSDMRLDDMTKQLRERWWGGLKVDYRIVSSLGVDTPRTKIKIYVREYSPPPDETRRSTVLQDHSGGE
jgi:phenylacetate-CoA ligase